MKHLYPTYRPIKCNLFVVETLQVYRETVTWVKAMRDVKIVFFKGKLNGNSR